MFREGTHSFTFSGKLKAIKDEKGEIVNLFETEKFLKKEIKFDLETKNQGTQRLIVTGNSFSVRFYELDENGVIKKVNNTNSYVDYKYGDAPLKWDNYLITDRYKIIAGKKELEEFHPLNFVNSVSKAIKNIDGKYVQGKGKVEKRIYKGKIYENYVITQIEILTSAPKDSNLTVTEVLGIKRDNIKNNKEIPTYDYTYLVGKDAKGFCLLPHKTLKIDKNFIFNGDLSEIFEEDGTSVLTNSLVEEFKEFPYIKVKFNYRPVTKNLLKEDNEDFDLNDLDNAFKQTYELLLKKGLEEKAKEFAKSVISKKRVAVGNFLTEYYLVDTEFSTENPSKSVETLTVQDWKETTVDLAESNAKKEERTNKKLKDFLVVNKEETKKENNILSDNMFDSDDEFDKEFSENNVEEVVDTEDDFFEEEENKKQEETQGVVEDIIEDEDDDFPFNVETEETEDEDEEEGDSEIEDFFK